MAAVVIVPVRRAWSSRISVGTAMPKRSSKAKSVVMVERYSMDDVGLSRDVSDAVRQVADPGLLEVAGRFKPQIVLEACRFSHIDPSATPRDWRICRPTTDSRTRSCRRRRASRLSLSVCSLPGTFTSGW